MSEPRAASSAALLWELLADAHSRMSNVRYSCPQLGRGLPSPPPAAAPSTPSHTPCRCRCRVPLAGSLAVAAPSCVR